MCGSTNGVGNAQQSRAAQEMMRTRGAEQAGGAREGMQGKGQLGGDQLQQYLQARAQQQSSGQQGFDARMLAESLKANAISA